MKKPTRLQTAVAHADSLRLVAGKLAMSYGIVLHFDGVEVKMLDTDEDDDVMPWIGREVFTGARFKYAADGVWRSVKGERCKVDKKPCGEASDVEKLRHRLHTSRG